MDIQLADGTVVKNVPDGVSPEQVQAKFDALNTRKQGVGGMDLAKSLASGVNRLGANLSGMADNSIIGDVLRAANGDPTHDAVTPLPFDTKEIIDKKRELAKAYLKSEPITKRIQKFFTDGAESWDKSQSAGAKAIKKYVQGSDSAGEAIHRYARQPSAAVMSVVENIPQIAAMLVTRKAPANAQAALGSVIESRMDGEDARQGAIADATKNGADALDTITASDTAKSIATAGSQGFSLLGAAGEVAALRKVTGKAHVPGQEHGLKQIPKQIISQGAEEFGQEASGQIGQNIGEQTYNPNKGTFDGAALAGVHGAVAGGIMGAGFGALAVPEGAQPTPEEEAAVSADQQANLDELRRQQSAESGVPPTAPAPSGAPADGTTMPEGTPTADAGLQQDPTQPAAPAPGLSGVVQRHAQTASPTLDAAFSDAIHNGQAPDFTGLAQQTGIDRNSLVDQFNAKRTEHVQKQGLMDLAENGDLTALRTAVSGITVDPQQQDQLMEEAVAGSEQRKAAANAATQQQSQQDQQQMQQQAQQQAEKEKNDQTYGKMLDEAVASLEGGETEVKTFLPIKKKYSGSGLNATDINGVIDHAKQVIAEKQQKAAAHEQAVTGAMPHLQSGDEASAVLAMDKAGITDDADVQSVLKEANKRIRQGSKQTAGTQSVPAGQQAAPTDPLSAAVAEVKSAQAAGKKVNLATIAKRHGVPIMAVAKGVAEKVEPKTQPAHPKKPLALPAPDGMSAPGKVMVSRNGKVMSQAEADALDAASTAEKKQMRRDMSEEAGNPTGIPTGMKPKVEQPARAEQKAVLPNLILRTDGKPFPDERHARNVMHSKKLADTHEVVSVEGGKAIAPKKKSVTAKNQVDPEKDDILTAIAKLGGIDREQAKRQGIDPADFNRRAGGIQLVFRKNGGKELDRMAEALSELGYPVTDNGDYTVNALLDSLDAALRGSAVGTPQFHEAQAQAMYEEEMAQAEIDSLFDSPGDSAEPDWMSAGGDHFVSSVMDGDVTPNAVIASELAGIENEHTVTGIPEAAGQKVDANPAQSSGAKGIAAAAGGGTERQQKGKGDPQPDTAVQDFGLKAQTEAERLAEEQRVRAALDAKAKEDEQARLKAKADKEIGGFLLSGSDAPADVAMAHGQNDIFAPKTRGEKAAKADEVPPQASDFPNAASYHAALADFRKANPPAPRAGTEQASSDRRAEIKRELAVLEKQYKQRMNKRSGLVPQSIKTDVLNSIARRMSGLDAELKELDAAKSKENPVATIKTEATISDSDYAQVVEAAKYLKDIVYSMDNLVGDDTDLLIALSSDLGKSGRDTILMDAFGIDRSLAHTINNRLDDRKPHKLRAVDMGDAFTMFPMLRKVVDDAKEVIRKRDERRAARDAESKAASRQAKAVAPEVAAIESKPEPVKWFGSRDKAEAWIAKVSKVNGGAYHVVQAGPSRFEVFAGKKPAAPVEPNAFPIGKDGMPLRKAIVPLSQADALIALMDGNKIIFNRDTEYQEEIWLEENTARNTWVIKTRSGGAVVTEGPAGPGKAWSQMDAAAKAVEGKTYKANLRGKKAGDVLTDADGNLYRIESLDDEGTIITTKNPDTLKERRARIQQDQYDRILSEHKSVTPTKLGSQPYTEIPTEEAIRIATDAGRKRASEIYGWAEKQSGRASVREAIMMALWEAAPSQKATDASGDVDRIYKALFDEAKAAKPRPGDAGYTVELADKDLDAMLDEQRQNGLVKDDRLAERIRRQERLIDEMRADEKAKASPADDLDSMFDDVLAEVTGSKDAKPDAVTSDAVESGYSYPSAIAEMLFAELKAQKARVLKLTGGDATKLKAAATRLQAMRAGIHEAEDTLIPSAISGNLGALAKLESMGFVDTADAVSEVLSPTQAKPRASKPRKQQMRRVTNKDGSYYSEPISGERTAGQSAVSAVKNAASALDDALDGLGKLFGGNKLSSGLTFDKDTYAKAKPLFQSAIAHLRASGSDLREAMQAVVKMVVERFGADTAANMKPYVIQFIADVRDGKIDSPAATLNDEQTNEVTGNDVRKLDTTGAGTLEGVSSSKVQRPETEQPVGAGADGSSRGNSEGNGRVPGAGIQRDGGVGNDTQPVPVSGTGGRERVGGTGRRSGRGTGGTVSEGVSAGNERVSIQGGGRRSGSSDANQPQVALEPGRIDPPQLPDDFIIKDDFGLGEGGQRTKYKQNVEAIKLVKALDAEGRTATTDEQAIIAKYVGWGGIPQAFDQSNSDWSAQYSELKGILTQEEYESARESTQYAHYTSREIIGAMYSALRQFGFTGGNVLEAGGGVGNFIGLMPVEMRTNGKVTLIEREHIASAIARHLYPRQNVRTADFTEFGKGQDNQYDAQIGNPPFSSTPLTDKSGRRHLSGLSVHNYFIAKGIDMLRPGGITAVVVSNSFMDATGDRARKYIGDRAKLLGAIRLPNNAFSKNANTQVTTDIIFLQKLPEAEWGGKSARDDAKKWVETDGVRDPKGGKDIPTNRYFASNPQMMLGQWGRFGTMYGPDQPALVAHQGQNTGDLMEKALASLPKDVFKSLSDERKKAMEGSLLERLHDESVSEGGFYVDNGKLWRRINDVVGEEMSESITANTIIFGTKPIGDNGVSRLTQLATMRKTMRSLLAAEIADDTKAMDGLRSDLNRLYDSYVRDNGKLNDPTTKRLMRDDPDYPLLAALEMDYEPGMGPAAAKKVGIKPYSSKAKKAAIFDRRVIEARKPVTTADSPQDAINISMAERGRLDADYVGKLLGIPHEEVLDQLSSGSSPLLFRDPATGEYVLRDAYLSGNVREKLKQAQAAGMSSNARALEEVMPDDVPASQISVRLGSPWVPVDVYRDFAKHLFGEETKTLVSYISANGSFNGVIKPESDVIAMTKFGTKSYPGDALMLALMNNRQIKVTYRDSDGKTHTDQKATEEANAKADEIKQAFQDWAFKDADRAELMARSYNDANNNYVVRKYDGSWLSFPGKVPDAIITFRRHQRNAIARTVQDRTSLYDHVVGAGKTFTAIASAMELKRTGLANKPMMVVPNHLVGQWAADFYRLYPGAKVLAATKKDFERTNRRKFMAKIASGDWDAIIIAHSSFSYIKPNPEFELHFNQGQIDGIVRDIEAVKAEDGEEQQKKRTVKQLEKLKESLENKIARLRDKPMDDLLDFQQLGVDQLFVDEAHLFKNLMFGTKMQNVRGLGDPSGSQRAYDMYLKTRQLMDQNGRGQGVVFMTGTPVSNSLAEMYHMMRYLMPQQMEQLGFDSFDAWANTFASVNQVWMQNASGDGFKAQNRMSSFDNIPELLKMFDQVADTVTMDDIKAAFREENNGKEFPLPPLATGRRIPVPLEKSDAQIEYMEEIAKRAKALEQRRGPPQKGDDNVLVLMTDARKAAMDIRLVNPDVMGREAGGRIDRASDEIVSRWKKYADQRGVQLVFSDLGTPKSAVKAELKEYEALMARVNAAANQDVIDDANLGVESALDILADAEDAQNTIEAKGADWLGSIQAAQRGFSVYDDLKSALVEKGIPENQIAFIHDYNTDDQKAALFRKVNNGDIRVMVGSTPKMGAGTNVQKRLVALHHLDVPWKPSDLEQREGRIIRQGNLLSDEEVDRKPNPLRIPGFEVEILAYVTKDTLDMRMWQIQETKLKMINQLRSRQIDRDMENAFEEMEMSAGEMQAAATGNMDLLREIQLRTEVQKLEKKQRAFDAGRADVISGLRRAKAQMESIPGQILRAKVLAEGAEKVRNLYLEHVNSFKATINGKDYTDRTVASQALRDMTEAVETGDDGKERKAKLDVTLNGEHYTNRQKLAEAFARLTGDREPFVFEADGEVMHRLEDASDAILDDIEAAKESNAPRVIGSMGPFTVSIEYEGVSAGDRDTFNVYAEIGDADVSAVVRGGEDDRATGRNIARAVRDMVRDAPNGLDSEMKRLEKAKKTVSDYEKIDTSEAWPDGDKLESLRAEHRAILDRMNSSKPEEGQAANDGDKKFSVGEGSGPALTTTRAREILAADPALSKAMPFIEVKNSRDGVPAGAEAIGAEGYYHNGKVTLFADNIKANATQTAEERLKWVAFHEITHRGVANLAESMEYMAELQQAGKNPFIKNLAKKIYAKRLGTPYEVSMDVAVEEALAEANAALQTGSSKTIKDQYGLHFPLAIRGRAKSAIARFFEAVKRIYNKLTGRGLTNEQVGDLLRKTHEAGMGPGDGPGNGAVSDSSMAMSMGGSKPKGMSVSAVQAVADKFLYDYNGNIPLTFRVVNKQEDAYGYAGRPEKIGVVEGVYHAGSGTVVLAAVNIYDEGQALTTIRHEVLGHYGLNTFDGVDKKALLKKIIESRDSPLLHGVWSQVDESYSDMSEMQRAEEVFAFIAEREHGKISGIWNDILAAVLAGLRHAGIVTSPITNAELTQLARQIAKGIRNGELQQKNFPKDDYSQFRREEDHRYSAPPTSQAVWTGKKNTLTQRVKDRMGFSSGEFGSGIASSVLKGWANSVGTQLNTAMKVPAFKRTYDLNQRFLQHISNDAHASVTVAPNLLGKLDSWQDYKRDMGNIAKFKKLNADRKAASAAIFEGTRFEKKVFSDAELRDQYSLTPDQIAVYREARAAIDTSLGNFAKSEATSLLVNAGAINWHTVESMINEDMTTEAYFAELEGYVDSRIAGMNAGIESAEAALEDLEIGDQTPDQAKSAILKMKAEVKLYEEALTRVTAVKEKMNELISEGYAPLMRWGKYAVSVTDPATGELLEFYMHESKGDQNENKAALTRKYGRAAVSDSIMDESAHEQFKGITPETIALFARETGMDKDAAYQEYLKLALPGRSALKRKIHRKGKVGEGIEGFSNDLQRVVSSFVMSNARKSANNVYRKAIGDSLDLIPADSGDVRHMARKLNQFVTEPTEQFPLIRNMLFVWNMGGSVAFGLLNLTQPMMMTLPWLSQFTSPEKAAGALIKATKVAFKAQADGSAPKGYEAEYARAVNEGHVDPQNVYMLQGIERGDTGLGSSILKTLAHGMGLFASYTESINRKATLIAALDVARAKGKEWVKGKGFASDYDFAVQAVAETQGVYNKGNRPKWARSPIGALLMVFKQYSINWVEMAARMAKNHYGDDKYRKGFWMMLGLLFSMAGGMGLPFVKDITDIVESVMYAAGKPVNVERQMQMALGKDLAEPVLAGPMNAWVFNQMGADMQGRMSMGDMIPGTAAFNFSMSPEARLKEGMSVIGASASLGDKAVETAKALAGGRMGDAVTAAMPRSITSLIKAKDMLSSNQYKDTRGNKVLDTTMGDAVVKALDLQPAKVAQVQRERSRQMKDIAIQQSARKDIRNDLIAAYESNDAKNIQAAEDKMDQWNKDNPLYTVNIKRRDIRKAVRDRSKGFSEGSVPKGMEWMKNYQPNQE